MRFVSKSRLHSIGFLSLAAALSGSATAQLVCCDSFADYALGSQLEDGSNNEEGSGGDGGAGWGGPYNVANNIKQLVRIEDRASYPALYSSGEISIPGGDRALRFYNNANGAYALRRPLGATFQAVSGETLWFGFLFRTSNAGPLQNQDFFQVGFDSSPNASGPGNGGNPRVSIGANTTSTSFPAPFRFFARSTIATDASVFCDNVDIQAATTYLLVGSVRPNDQGKYDVVSLFVNPASLDNPGPPSASITMDSGLNSIGYFFIRTAGLESSDAYVIDELRVARDYKSVVQTLRDSLKIDLPGASESAALRWPASLTGAVLETSATLAAGSWVEVPGPYPLAGADHAFLIAIDPEIPREFFRLRQ